MPRLALTGGAYQARSVIASAQRSLNLFAEPIAQSTGEPAQFAHYPTPGLAFLSTLPESCVRGIRQVATGGIYAVAGTGVYRVDTTTWSGTHLGDITAHITTPVSMMDNGKTLIIVDGSANGWTVDLTTDEFDSIGRAITIPPAFTATGSDPILFGIARYTPFTSTVDGFVVTELSVDLAAGYTGGGMKAAIYTSSTVTGLPDSVLVSADDLANPVTGNNRFKVSQAAPLEANKTYWLGFVSDVSSGAWATEGTGAGCWSFGAFAEFPQDNPVITRGTNALVVSLHLEDDPGGMFTGADRVDFLDGYFVFNKPATPEFYISLNGSQSFDPLALDFANKGTYSDMLVTLAVAKGEIWLLGKQTTEVWFNAGAADFAFQRRDGVFIDHGIAAKYSVATYDDAVFWLAYNRAGQGVVMQGQNYQTHRISTYAIEAHLTTVGTLSDAIGMVYSLGGHAFYALTFPAADQTWVYDVTTQQWHEWLWIDNDGIEHRHRANCCAFINGQVVCGDWQNGNLYRVASDVYTDNGQPIKRQRSFPHIVNEMDRVFYRQFIADIESGNPAGDPEASVRTLEQTSFTAPDGTLLSAYSNPADTNATWTLVSGAEAAITGGELTGPSGGGSSLYQSPTMAAADYTLQFQVIPSGYVAASTGSLFAIARSTGAGTGYRATVAGDGSQYHLTLDTEGGTSTTLAMGTLASGQYAVTMKLQGAQIAVTAQRSSDGMFLQPSGVWSSANVPAIQIADSTYTSAGTIMIGGSW